MAERLRVLQQQSLTSNDYVCAAHATGRSTLIMQSYNNHPHENAIAFPSLHLSTSIIKTKI